MRLRIALATAAVSLALPALASADTFCVNKSPCLLGTPKSTLQDALVAAEQHPGPDIVRIGARSQPYEGNFSYSAPVLNPVHIVGDGPGQTVLAAGPSANYVLSLGVASKVSGVTVRPAIVGGSKTAGLMLDGADAQNVSVVASGPAATTTGIVTSHDSDLRDVTVDMGAGLALRAEDGPQSTTLERSTLSADAGVEASEGAVASLRDVRILATTGGAGVSLDGQLRLFNVLVATSAPGGVGVSVGVGFGAGDGRVVANHVTIGRTATTSDAAGVMAGRGSVALQNTIIHGYGVPIMRSDGSSGGGPNLSSSDLSVRHTNFDQSASLLNQGIVPGTVALGPGNRNVDPRFAAPGDFHLRGDSELIDAGELTSLSDETDIEGLDRDKDGDGDLDGVVDLGAYEYQRAQPVADFLVGPASAGAPVAFDAAPSGDADPGDESGFTYSWSFGDGGGGSGRTPEHVYADPGEYTVDLTVTDPGGRTAAATRVVSVGAAPAGAAGGGSGGPDTSAASGADVVAPVISGLRVTRRGRIRFRLSEQARVTLRLESRRSGRRKGVLRLDGRAGLNTVRLLRRRALRPGAYRLTVRARDAAGNAAKARRTHFALRSKR